MKENVSRYIYRVEWSPEDGEHVGLCTNFPAFPGLRRLRPGLFPEFAASCPLSPGHGKNRRAHPGTAREPRLLRQDRAEAPPRCTAHSPSGRRSKDEPEPLPQQQACRRLSSPTRTKNPRHRSPARRRTPATKIPRGQGRQKRHRRQQEVTERLHHSCYRSSKLKRSGIPSSPGIYWCLFPRTALKTSALPRCAKDCIPTGENVPLYCGIANDLKRRIKEHAAQQLTRRCLLLKSLSTLVLTCSH
jgi:hypothetical protein